jgi:hypothetical protein
MGVTEGWDPVIFCFLSLQEVDNDIESIGSEGAVNYDRLIKQTLAKKRKSRRLRFTCAVFTFLIVVAVVGIPLTCLTPPHFCACPKPGSECSTYVVVFFEFS